MVKNDIWNDALAEAQGILHPKPGPMPTKLDPRL